MISQRVKWNLAMNIVIGTIEFSGIDGDDYADIHQICAFEGMIVLFVNDMIATLTSPTRSIGCIPINFMMQY